MSKRTTPEEPYLAVCRYCRASQTFSYSAGAQGWYEQHALVCPARPSLVVNAPHPLLDKLAACAAGDRKAYVLLKAPRNAWVDGKVTAVDYASGFVTVRVDVHSGSRALVGWNDWTFNVNDVAMLREHHDVPA